MERRTLLLCDWEEDYARAMTSFIREDSVFAWRVETITKVPKEISDKIDILLIAETVYEKCHASIHAKTTIVLSESGLCVWDDVEYVDKYQSADAVYRKVLEIYMKGQKETIKRVGVTRRGRVLGFYAPSESVLQEAIVLAYGQKLAARNKVLYVGMRCFHGFCELTDNSFENDLMTVLYYLESDKIAGLVQSGMRSIGGLHLLTGQAGHNLSHITPKQWEKLLAHLLHDGEYDYILLDMTDAVQGVLELLHQCHRIYTLTDKGNISKCRNMQYSHLLEAIACEDILEKTTFLDVPEGLRAPTSVCELTKSEVADYVQQMLGRE